MRPNGGIKDIVSLECVSIIHVMLLVAYHRENYAFIVDCTIFILPYMWYSFEEESILCFPLLHWSHVHKFFGLGYVQFIYAYLPCEATQECKFVETKATPIFLSIYHRKLRHHNHTMPIYWVEAAWPLSVMVHRVDTVR